MDEVEKKATFSELRRELFRVTKAARDASKRHGQKLANTDRVFWASVIMTRIAVAGLTAKKIFPGFEKKDHWDFSSFAAVARSILEAYILFYWLCFEEITESEWQLRRLTLYLFDLKSRWRMSHGDEPLDPDNSVYLDLLERLHQCEAYQILEKSQKQRILRAKGMPFIQDDILEKIGVEKTNFRKTYRFLSEHVHSGPVSFFRMAEHGRGMGFSNPVDRDFFIMTASMVNWTIESATVEYDRMFEGAV